MVSIGKRMYASRTHKFIGHIQEILCFRKSNDGWLMNRDVYMITNMGTPYDYFGVASFNQVKNTKIKKVTLR